MTSVLTAFTAVLLLSACAQPQEQGPVAGRWHGDDGRAITNLTLDGNLQSGTGHYTITSLTRYFGSHGSDYEPWSGIWTRDIKTLDGRPQTIIRLQGALNNQIDRYSLDRAGILEPTSELVHRPLTTREISLYSLYPDH